MGISALPFYTSGLFIVALGEAFGWSRSAVSTGNLAMALGLALSAPFVGGLAERRGPRRVAMMSAGLMALGYLGLGLIQGVYGAYLGLMFVTGFVGGGTSAVVFTRIVVSHFNRYRGLALGIALMGVGLTAIWGPVVVERALRDFGWQGGYGLLFCASIIMLPLMIFLRSEQPTTGVQHTTASVPGKLSRDIVREALLSRPFVMLAFATMLMVVAIAGPMVHLVPLLMDRGVEAPSAARIAGTIGIALIVSRLVIGAALDHFHPSRLGAAIMIVGAIGTALVGFGNMQWTIVGALLLGTVLGAEIDLLAFLVARYFRHDCYGVLFGVLYAIALIFAGVAPLVYAVSVDYLGDYTPALAGSIVALMIAGVLLLGLGGQVTDSSRTDNS
ncbi:MFS transporter [Haliea sp.]